MGKGSGPATYLFQTEMSLGGRFWTLGEVDDAIARILASKTGGNDLLGRLLARRDVEPGEVDAFLSPTLRNTFPDPSSFADMDRAVELTLDALQALCS